MTIDTVPAGTIVVGVDGSRQADLALNWGVDQCVLERRPLTLAHAIPPIEGVWLDQGGVDHRVGVDQRMQAAAQHVLSSARASVARRAPDLEVHEVIRVQDPRRFLMDLGRDAAMLVVGSRGRGPVRSLLLGSVGVALTRHAPCPVVIHRPGGHPGKVHQGVLVGVDGSSRSAPVLEFAYSMASLRGLPLCVVHCWEDQVFAVGAAAVTTFPDSEGEEKKKLELAEAMAGLGEKYPEVRVRTEIAHGLAGAVLALQGERMNLVVLGSHHGGLPSQLLPGSVTARVVEHVPSPVAVVPVE